MPRFASLSIRTVLGLLFGAMSVLLVVLTANNLASSVKEWRNAGQVRSLTTVSQQLFKTILGTRLERGTELTAVLTDAPADQVATSRIRDNRAVSETGYAETLGLLQGIDVPGLAAALGRLRAAHEDMAGLRPTIDSQITKPKADREASLPTTVPKVTTAYLDALVAASDVLESGLQRLDPVVDHLLAVKRAAWAVRNFGGLVAVRMENARAAEKSWSQADVAAAGEDAGKAAMAWTLVGEEAANPHAPPALVAAVAKGNDYFSGPMAEERKGMIATLSGNGTISMPMSAMQKRDTAELNLIVDVVNVALDEMIARATLQRSRATGGLATSGIFLLVALGLASAGFLVGHRRISLPLRWMTELMRRLADGDLSVEIGTAERGDEIGAMAAAVRVFKENALRVERMAAERAAETASKEARARTTATLTENFDQAVSGVVEVVAGAAAKLETTAQALSATANQTDHQATSVAAASGEASASVQTVASAAEELEASIKEIAQQVEHSSRVSQIASEEAAHTNQIIQGLADSSARIGDVVKLITAIAAQTNLLALNATIEAARAGDAGKGFAVVAGEVKNLANQTARATDEISAQIGAVQSATQDAVAAIQGIVNRIDEINQIAGIIAAAIEEQSAATGEIARNVDNAAVGTRDISANIEGMTQATAETGSAASQVLASAHSLSAEATQLNKIVREFLGAVRAA
jgi:methyl-accepting chemotaxis protein